MNEPNAFDADLTSLMNGEVPQSPAPTPAAPQSDTQPATQSAPASKSWKAGGREWTSPDELAKSHDSLWREFGKRNQEWAELKDLREVKKKIADDPEFAKYLRSSVESFDRARQARTPQQGAQPTPTGQLPPEVMAQIKRAEDAANLFELERETNALVRKYNLQDADVRKVEEYSMANGGIPLEQAYKQYMFDTNQERIAAAKKAEAQKKQDASKAGSPVPGHYQPTPRGGPSMKSDAEWRKAAGAELGKYFHSDES